MMRDFVVFYGEGEAVFGDFVRDYLAAAQQGRSSRLEELMTRHGSDKATWHSYPLFYEMLLERLERPPSSLFEIGIGSNDVEVPGNMGASGVPGASLRAWSEFLPDTIIYGADHDTTALLEERNVRSFYIDQFDPQSILKAWSILPHLSFDVVIDDGAHTFEANTNMLDNTFERVNPGGFYVIEDIVTNLTNLGRFEQYFQARGWPTLMMRLPHAENRTDNAVAVVRPRTTDLRGGLNGMASSQADTAQRDTGESSAVEARPRTPSVRSDTGEAEADIQAGVADANPDVETIDGGPPPPDRAFERDGDDQASPTPPSRDLA